METDSPRAVHAAELIGSNPFVLLGLLAGLSLALFAMTLAALWWAQRRGIGWRSRVLPRDWTPLHVAIGVAIASGALTFGVLAEEANEKSSVVTFDLALARSLHVAADARLTSTFVVLTQLGGFPALTVAGVVVTAALLFTRRRQLATAWAVAAIGAGALNIFLKALFQRPRPAFSDPLVTSAGWSFPSGHAMGTFVIAGMLVYVGAKIARSTRARFLFLLAAITWTIAIGFSRIYLGVHYASDVVAGYAAGTVWLTMCISATELGLLERAKPASNASAP